MKKKVFIKDINDIITEKFNNAKLLFPDAVKEGEEKSYIAYITEGTEYIGVGNSKKISKHFKDWDAAAEYIKTLSSGVYYIGIKRSGQRSFNAVAEIKIVNDMVNGFDNKEMHDKCLEEIEEYVYDISIEDVSYDRESGLLDIKCDNGFTIHLHPIDAWFSFEASEQNYTELQEALDLMNRYNDGAFDEFLPKAEVA